VKILIAGIGNMFLGDDGFGSAVAQRLCGHPWPSHVTVVDYGIRGMDLAFALTSGIDAAILVDACARGGEPGTLYKIEPTAGSRLCRRWDRR
jgi:hydrogenase maturation protease